ncbi:MAG: hypothetical protein J0I77_17060 [Rudaea sp.]|uniref:hypothetical protein n=1 Tax=unclassified Rudaea TaxID=2627037 RepID=UPI0010F50BCF|nr:MULTISPECIES: hypothetical protein [unclassified Rudaea]MBN8887436.1 hypothetical protein [Rudaea sp.]
MSIGGGGGLFGEIGSIIGGVIGGPIGSMIGQMLGQLVSQVANEAIQQAGQQMQLGQQAISDAQQSFNDAYNGSSGPLGGGQSTNDLLKEIIDMLQQNGGGSGGGSGGSSAADVGNLQRQVDDLSNQFQQFFQQAMKDLKDIQDSQDNGTGNSKASGKAGLSGGGDWFSALARALGKGLQSEADAVKDLSDKLCDAAQQHSQDVMDTSDSGKAQASADQDKIMELQTQLTAESMRLSYMTNGIHSAITQIGQSLSNLGQTH